MIPIKILNAKKDLLAMSKVGQWVFEMQEDSYDISLTEFIHKYGASQSSIWHEVQQGFVDMSDFMEMDDGA
jgi:hypothetical protein